MPAKMNFYTLEERQKIDELLKRKVSRRNISKILNRSYSGICYEIRKAGGKGNYDAVFSQKLSDTNKRNAGAKNACRDLARQADLFDNPAPRSPEDSRIFNRKLKPLSLDDRIQIKKLLDDGFSYAYIARSLKRAPSHIWYELKRHGGRLNYNPEFAHHTSSKHGLFKSQGVQELKSEYDSMLELSRQIQSQNIKKQELEVKEPTDLESRICSLEFQIEIIIEQLKRLTK